MSSEVSMCLTLCGRGTSKVRRSWLTGVVETQKKLIQENTFISVGVVSVYRPQVWNVEALTSSSSVNKCDGACERI